MADVHIMTDIDYANVNMTFQLIHEVEVMHCSHWQHNTVLTFLVKSSTFIRVYVHMLLSVYISKLYAYLYIWLYWYD